MRFQVRLIEHEEGFTVLCPDLPGCVSEGDTEVEALENISDAIQCYLESVSITRGPSAARELLDTVAGTVGREVAVEFDLCAFSPDQTQRHA